MADQSLKIFVSSPGDVAEERVITGRVIERLQAELAKHVSITPVFWEHEPLLASEGFQTQISPPADSDITIVILWSRLGTRLPPNLRREDQTRYASGTEYEFENALEGWRVRGRPDLLVYRKTTEAAVSLVDENQVLERLRQKKALEQFIEKWFEDSRDGTLIAAFHPFEKVDQFEDLLEIHLRKLIEGHGPSDHCG